jgi:DNA-binding response OmpR family regulator
MATILIIEDEAAILLGLEDALIAEGYEVLSARNGELGLKFALEETRDLIILDIMLPKLGGFEVLKQLRARDKCTPVVLLTARGQEKDKIQGFNLGADDYVTKPFSVKELTARVKAVLKRSHGADLSLASYDLGDIHLDFKALKAERAGRRLDLAARDLEVLRYLIERRCEVVTRHQLLQDVWRYDPSTMPTTRTIDNYIVKLRRVLEKNPDRPRHILTVHGKGYRFEE